jgi:hypothetical protein
VIGIWNLWFADTFEPMLPARVESKSLQGWRPRRDPIAHHAGAVSIFGALSLPGRVLPHDRQMGNVLTHLDKAKVDQFCHVGLVDYPFSL